MRTASSGPVITYRGLPLPAASCGAKHALQSFTEAVRGPLIDDKSHGGLTMGPLLERNGSRKR